MDGINFLTDMNDRIEPVSIPEMRDKHSLVKWMISLDFLKDISSSVDRMEFTVATRRSKLVFRNSLLSGAFKAINDSSVLKTIKWAIEGIHFSVTYFSSRIILTQLIGLSSLASLTKSMVESIKSPKNVISFVKKGFMSWTTSVKFVNLWNLFKKKKLIL